MCFDVLHTFQASNNMCCCSTFLISLLICLLLLLVNYVDGNHFGKSDLEEPNANLPRKNGRAKETTNSKHSKNVQGTNAANEVCTKEQVERDKAQSTMTCNKHKL
jgi:hypothetical protein